MEYIKSQGFSCLNLGNTLLDINVNCNLVYCFLTVHYNNKIKQQLTFMLPLYPVAYIKGELDFI